MALFVSCESDHHQPSRCISSAADTILSATAVKSSSV
jgi:hypothetical protein